LQGDIRRCERPAGVPIWRLVTFQREGRVKRPSLSPNMPVIPRVRVLVRVMSTDSGGYERRRPGALCGRCRCLPRRAERHPPRAASRVKVAVIDSGADLSAPNVGDKAPATWSVLSHSHKVKDVLGHGTFVASIAAGSVRDGVGIAGFGGDAKLLAIQAIDRNGY